MLRARPRLPLLAACLLLCGAARAEIVPWEGTLALAVGDLGTPVAWTGTGLATVNASSGGGPLQTLRLTGGLPQPVHPTIPLPFAFLDVPTHPLIKELAHVRSAGPGTGTLGSFGGSGPLAGGIPFLGVEDSAGVPFPHIPLTTNAGQTGLGVGGQRRSFGDLLNHFVSIEYAPRTLGSAQVVNSRTAYGVQQFGPLTHDATGFAHGPASGTSLVVVAGALLQLVAPMQVTLEAWNHSGSPVVETDRLGQFGRLTLRFLPEPDLLALLGAGGIALALMGWRRRRA